MSSFEKGLKKLRFSDNIPRWPSGQYPQSNFDLSQAERRLGWARAKEAQWDKPVPLFRHVNIVNIAPHKYIGGGYGPPSYVLSFVLADTGLCVHILYISFASLVNYLYIFVQSTWTSCMCGVHISTILHGTNKLFIALGPNGPLLTPKLGVYYPAWQWTRVCGLWGPIVHFNPPIVFFYPVTCLVDCFYPSNPQWEWCWAQYIKVFGGLQS